MAHPRAPASALKTSVAGDTAVSKEKFQAIMARAEKSYEANKRPFPKPGSAEVRAAQRRAVTFLVVRAEFEQELENLGEDVTDDDVEKEIAKLKKQYYGNDDKRYEQALETQGLTQEQAKEELRANLVAQKLYNKVTEDVTVSDEEIKEYYDTHKSQYVQPQSREVRHILVEKKALATSSTRSSSQAGTSQRSRRSTRKIRARHKTAASSP